MAVEKSDADDIDGSSWNKISNKALIVGYKEGVDNAKDQVLQEGFDVGYVRGLDIGLRLGFYNALSSVPLGNQLKASLSPEMFDKMNDVNTASVLKKPSMGNCQMCADAKILEYPMASAFQIQDQCNDTMKEKLDGHFLEVCTHLGIGDNIIKI